MARMAEPREVADQRIGLLTEAGERWMPATRIARSGDCTTRWTSPTSPTG